MKGYTTREVGEVLGLPASRIRSWARSGLLTPQRGPRGEYVFSFQDIVLLRTARELLEKEVPARKVRAALEALRTQLPVGRPLSAVHVSAVGDRILVHDGEAAWDPDSGQLVIDFSVAEIARDAEPVARRAIEERPAEPDRTADEWYDAGLDLEAVAPDEAATAYGRALALDPLHADAHLNLGRLLHEDGRLADAEEHYRAAIHADPESGRARYNLGVVLEDGSRETEALTAYREALELEPELAAAHFNLSRLHEAAGRQAEALSHLSEYKRLIERGGLSA